MQLGCHIYDSLIQQLNEIEPDHVAILCTTGRQSIRLRLGPDSILSCANRIDAATSGRD
jgi:hypothetical protein